MIAAARNAAIVSARSFMRANMLASSASSSARIGVGLSAAGAASFHLQRMALSRPLSTLAADKPTNHTKRIATATATVSSRLSATESPIPLPELTLHLPTPVRSEFTASERLTTEKLEQIDVAVGVNRTPSGISDNIAFGTVKFLRFFADLFFRRRYVHRAVVLETVAAVPGMVAGMLRHLTSLRRMRHDGGWISHLLTEAENERMHLMTWMKVCSPSLFERIIIFTVQGAFFNVYFFAYMFFPRTAHRMVGYLEEEAVISYTHFLNEIDAGKIPNGPAPQMAKDYWNLDKDATIRDVVLAVRADEANHRDVNHHFADRISVHEEDLRRPVSNDTLRPYMKYRKIPIKE